jgi:hypothetical protein
MVIKRLKRSKLPGIDQISAELMKVGGRTIHPDIHKLVNSVWNKEKLPDEWKEPITVPTYKKADTTDCNNYTRRSTSILPTTYEIFSNFLLSRLIPYEEEIIGDHQCEF